LGWYTIYYIFYGSSDLSEFLPGAKFTLRPTVAFSYKNVTACTGLELWACVRVWRLSPIGLY